MLKPFAAGFLGTAALVAGILLTDDATAAFRTFHAAKCRPMYNSGAQGSVKVEFNNQGQVQNPSPENCVRLLCPVRNDNSFSILDASGLGVDISGYANGFSTNPAGSSDCEWNGGARRVVLAACRTFYGGNGTGGTCGTQNFQSTTGVFHATGLDLSQWTGGSPSPVIGDSFYVYAYLYPKDLNGSLNVLWSYELTSN
jgi:hypothetical protein